MSYRREPGSDAVYVIPTDDNAVHSDETEPPSKKTRMTPPCSDIGNLFWKTQLCCKFRAGICPNVSESCRFAHSVEELRPPPLESGRSYKGILCNKYRSAEGCAYGERCAFLHETSPRNSLALNWKTRLCSNWEDAGYCPYESNCRFAHGYSDLRQIGGGLVQREGTSVTSATPGTRQMGQADTVTSLVSPRVPPQGTASAVTQRPNGVKPPRKWKGPNKISRIYGDWIDD